MLKSKDIHGDSDVLEEDLIETRIGVHDSNHFEVKLDYAIRSQDKSCYTVDYYFFVPSSLGLNKHTYRNDHFFSDVQAYIRFKTPTRSLASLVGEVSPLDTIRELAMVIRRNPNDAEALQSLSYELRMFGCVVRVDIRDRVRTLREKLAEIRGDNATNQVLRNDAALICNNLAREVKICLVRWRELRPNFVDNRLPQACNETYAYVDEYLSLVIEMRMASVLRRLDHIEGGAGIELREARKLAKDLLRDERVYRAAANYSTVTSEHENDHFVYRQGLLKKFVTSILWLDLNREREGKRVANIGAAIAAGAAMSFAVMATIWAGRAYGLYSWNFTIAAVITYVLKDRIKDLGKDYLGAGFARFLADYSIQIRDPIRKTVIGRCRESFSFRNPSDVPDRILQYRRKDAKASIESMAKPEVIMHYSKQVDLRGKDVIERMHLEDYNVNDIVRFSLNQFLVRADDPTSSIPYFVEQTDSVEYRSFRKVYHLNLIMHLQMKGAKRSRLKRVRVIFDKKSILELQEVR